MHLHQPVERVAGAMLQRHFDTHTADPITPGTATQRLSKWHLAPQPGSSAPTSRSARCQNRIVATWEDLARIVAALPETSESPPRNWKLRKKLIAWERPLRKTDLQALGDAAPDGDILGVRVSDEGVKFALIA